MEILQKVQALSEEAQNFTIDNKEQLEAFRLKYLSQKGALKQMMGEMKNIEPQDRKTFGMEMNKVKKMIEARFKSAQDAFGGQSKAKKNQVDVSLPVLPDDLGSIHPLTIVKNQIVSILERMGFAQSEGPEIEDDFHNFTALNFPPNHPAREMQDTFFIEKDPDIVLRTHTSSVQVRMMQSSEPPLRTFSVGRVFRNEAISARAHCIFHQIEGFFIDENVSFVDLKQTLYHFVKELFGQDIKIRFRPSYFPFTEPSAEMDISCNICKGEGCNICKYTGWVEIGGAGMIDTNVLKESNIDTDRFTGFAFGMGLERITMLKYLVKDLRLYTENDLRFLKQFQGVI